mmetsp:Transcript_7998/g.18242  ORF Transcript_7998/g.18242 Transcript_7998/m.18242 type:complete len:270 (-) Transcript_7998:224-1033(-)
MEIDQLVPSEEGKTETSTKTNCLDDTFCMSIVSFGLAPISIVQIILAADVNWRWGTAIASLGLVEGIWSLVCMFVPRMRTKLNRTVKIFRRPVKLQNANVLVGNVLFWYILTTASIHLIPQMRRTAFVSLNSVGFPSSCPSDSINCVRLGNNTDTFRANSLRAPKIHGGLKEVQKEIVDWINSHGGTITYRDEKSIRARFVTFLMGYLDDFATFSFCDKDGIVNVNVQSQSRIGKSDLNKNYQRISDLVQTLIDKCSTKSGSSPCGGAC